MTTLTQQKFEERRLRIKKNILADIEEYYSDPREWEDVSTDLVRYGIFYSQSCEQWLKSILLYKYDATTFAHRFLKAEIDAKIDINRLQKHHYGLLSHYSIDRTAVILLINRSIDRDSLQKAANYYQAYLDKNNYLNEADLVKNLDTESMLSTVVPQIIVNKLLNIGLSTEIKRIDPALKSKEKIWIYAWRLLRQLYSNTESNLKPHWNNLTIEWKNCFIKADFHAFKNSYIVLLYYLYCQTINQVFNIKDLSEELLNA